MAQFSRFSFTIFDNDIDNYDRIFEGLPELLGFLCHQKEQCPKTGKVHFQGYCETKTKRTLSGFIKWFHSMWPTAHIEPSRGSYKQNLDYCSKSDTSVPGSFHMEGTPMQQGKRSDISEVLQMIRDGSTIEQVIDEHPHMYDKIKHLETYRARINRGLRDVKVTYLWGPTGSGKTTWAWEYAQKNNKTIHFVSPTADGKTWHDGYDGQDIEVLDDIDLRNFPRTYLLRLFDRFPLLLNCKGSMTPALFTEVIVTSNYPLPTTDPALVRRFHNVIHLE